MRLVLLTLLSLTAGCMYLPRTPRPEPTAVAGYPDAPFKVGETSREAVINFLGPPRYQSDDQRELRYRFKPVVGRRFGILQGPCAYTGFSD